MVYLLHFLTRIGNDNHSCNHYIGYTKNWNTLSTRLEHHRNGTAQVALTNYTSQNNIEFELVRVWEDGDKKLERKLKNNGHYKRHCPKCNTKVPAPYYEGF